MATTVDTAKSFPCIFCKTDFPTCARLHKHQRRAMYCLELQQKHPDRNIPKPGVNYVRNFTCEFCDRTFNLAHRARHLAKCKVKINNIITEKDKKIEELTSQKMTKKTDDQSEHVKKLEDKLEKYKNQVKDQEIELEKLRSTPSSSKQSEINRELRDRIKELEAELEKYQKQAVTIPTSDSTVHAPDEENIVTPTQVDSTETVPVVKPVDSTCVDYSKMTGRQMRDLCAKRGYTKYHNLDNIGLRKRLAQGDVENAIPQEPKDIQDMTKKELIKHKVAENVEEVVPVEAGIFQNFTLKLKGGKKMDIPVRKDGYVNVTAIFKAAGKRIDNWKTSDDYTELCECFAEESGMIVDDFLQCVRGSHEGTFAHPDIAAAVASCAYKPFALQVSKWVRELLTTGSVKIDKPVMSAPVSIVSTITTGATTHPLDTEALEIAAEYDMTKNTDCMVLYVAYIGNGLVKVGSSDHRLHSRMDQHRGPTTEYSQFLLLESFEISSSKVEFDVHRMLSMYNVVYNKQKEVFRPPRTLRIFVSDISRFLETIDHKLIIGGLRHELEIERMNNKLMESEYKRMILEQRVQYLEYDRDKQE